MARPSKYRQEIADKICESVATTSKGLRAISTENGIDYSTVKRWLRDNEVFCTQYARAKEDQADHLLEEIIEISDDNTKDTIPTDKGDIPNNEWINRSRLRVDTRKWIMGKLKPKKYGDKLDVTLTKVGKDLADESYD